jgi:hypothetical protein
MPPAGDAVANTRKLSRRGPATSVGSELQLGTHSTSVSPVVSPPHIALAGAAATSILSVYSTLANTGVAKQPPMYEMYAPPLW